MYQKIKKIRASTSVHCRTDKISKVKLANGDIQPISVVKARMNIGVTYFYLAQSESKNIIKTLELCHPLYKNPYIKTCNFNGSAEEDPLCDLPRF